MSWNFEAWKEAARAGRVDEVDWAQVHKLAVAEDVDAKYLLFFSPDLSRKKRRRWLSKAAEDGQSDAYFEMHGERPADILERLLAEARGGSADAQYELGMRHIWWKPKNLEQSCYWYRQAAQQGHPVALYETGFSMLMGEAGVKDTIQGIEYLEQAAIASGGWPADEARKLLADVYTNGHFDVPLNPDRAHFWKALDDFLETLKTDEETIGD